MNTRYKKQTQGRLYVGARTTPGRGHGRGITLLDSAVTVAQRSPTRAVQELPAVNPGSIVLSPNGHFLYAAHGDRSSVSAYRITEAGVLEWDHEQDSGGTNPAHITCSPQATHLLIANHTSGSVTSIPILGDDTLGRLKHSIEFEGQVGPHRHDQSGTKPHQVIFSPCGRFLAVPDKGLDTVFFCSFDELSGNITQVHAAELRQGAGPRHMVFHPNLPRAYVLNELDNTVTALDLADFPDYSPKPIQVMPSLPDTDIRDSRAAEILINPNGSRLYVSNRSGAGDKTPGGPEDDWIGTFSLSDTGHLEQPLFVSSNGIRPRFMTLSPDASKLLVANEKSGTIWTFELETETGVPVNPVLFANVSSPVSLCFG